MNSAAQANVFLVTGDDPAMIAVEAAKIVHRVAGEKPDAFALDIVREHEGAEAIEVLRQVLRSVQTPPFLGTRKTVWLKGFSGFASESAAAVPKTPEAVALRELAERISKGVPGDIALVLDGPGADPGKPLASACRGGGELVLCNRPTLRQREWRHDMRVLLERRAADKGLKLPAAVADYLTDILGTDTARLEGELEKLICYIGGPDQPVTRADAEQVCVGEGEELPWALSNALGRRELEEALRLIRVLLEQAADEGDGARSLLGQTAKFYRELLQMKVFMVERGLRTPQAVVMALQGLSAEEKERCRAEGLAVAAGNAFRGRPLAEQAEGYSGAELIAAVRTVRDAYLRCITSSVGERAVLEDVVSRTVAPAAAGTRGR